MGINTARAAIPKPRGYLVNAHGTSTDVFQRECFPTYTFYEGMRRSYAGLPPHPSAAVAHIHFPRSGDGISIQNTRAKGVIEWSVSRSPMKAKMKLLCVRNMRESSGMINLD